MTEKMPALSGGQKWAIAGGATAIIGLAAFVAYKAFSGEAPDENDVEAAKALIPTDAPAAVSETPPVPETLTNQPVLEKPDVPVDTKAPPATEAPKPADAAPTKTVPEAPVTPSETQIKIAKDIGISDDVLRDHVRGTSIVNDKGTEIAQIKTYRELGYDRDGYVVSTVGENKPFATVNKLKVIGIDLEDKNIAWANHTSDNGRTDIIKNACGDVVANYEMRQHNELIKVEYAKCLVEPEPAPVSSLPPVEVKPEPAVQPETPAVPPPEIKSPELCFKDIGVDRSAHVIHSFTYFEDFDGSKTLDSAAESATARRITNNPEAVASFLNKYFEEHPSQMPTHMERVVTPQGERYLLHPRQHHN